MSDDIWKKLAAEFPKSAISWRAQSLTKAGDKAMALAYITSRDVMDRLDSAVGPDKWQTRYEFNAGTAICYISIRIGGEWITKADGAGSTDIEAEKGQISDSFKRAAVHWGVARYLYDMPAPWVPCETYESNGKKHWKAWKEDPWDHVKRSKQPSEPKKEEAPEDIVARLRVASSTIQTMEDWRKLWEHPKTISAVGNLPADHYDAANTIANAAKKAAEEFEQGRQMARNMRAG